MSVNFQEPYLLELKTKGREAKFRLHSGDSLTGKVKAYDQFVIVVWDGERDIMIYKNSLSFIEPKEKTAVLQNG